MNREKEQKAALLIQKTYRRWTVRNAFLFFRYVVITIQRVFRGHLYGRRLKRQIIEERNRNEKNQFYHYCATQIQKVYRGFRVRKYVHNFYQRKEYLKFVEERAAHVNEFIDEYKRQRTDELIAEKEENEFNKFQEFSKSLHHLVSTKTIPGVYKPNHRYISEETVFGIPVEEQLRYVSKTEYIKTLGRSRRKEPSEPPKEKVIPPVHPRDMMRVKEKRYGPFKPTEEVVDIKERTMDRALQNSCNYDADLQSRRFESLIEKQTRRKYRCDGHG